MSKIIVILGSVREGRLAEKLLDIVSRELENNGYSMQDDIDIADPVLTQLPFYDEAIPPAYAKGAYKNKAGADWAQRVKDADKVLILAPEYNYSVPAVLKNMIDWAYEGWLNKPVAVISYGFASNGQDSFMHLRDIFEKLPSNWMGGAHLSAQDIKSENPNAYHAAKHVIQTLQVAKDLQVEDDEDVENA